MDDFREWATEQIKQLEFAAQKQLDTLANQDPVWTHIQGKLVAYREMLEREEKSDA